MMSIALVYKDCISGLHFSNGVTRKLGKKVSITTVGGSFNAPVLPLNSDTNKCFTLHIVGEMKAQPQEDISND